MVSLEVRCGESEFYRVRRGRTSWEEAWSGENAADQTGRRAACSPAGRWACGRGRGEDGGWRSSP